MKNMELGPIIKKEEVSNFFVKIFRPERASDINPQEVTLYCYNLDRETGVTSKVRGQIFSSAQFEGLSFDLEPMTREGAGLQPDPQDTIPILWVINQNNEQIIYFKQYEKDISIEPLAMEPCYDTWHPQKVALLSSISSRELKEKVREYKEALRIHEEYLEMYKKYHKKSQPFNAKGLRAVTENILNYLTTYGEIKRGSPYHYIQKLDSLNRLGFDVPSRDEILNAPARR